MVKVKALKGRSGKPKHGLDVGLVHKPKLTLWRGQWRAIAIFVAFL